METRAARQAESIGSVVVREREVGAPKDCSVKGTVLPLAVAGFEPNDDVPRSASGVQPMPRDELVRADRAFLDSVRRGRAVVREESRQSELTIEESMELLRRMDEVVAKVEKKK
jgi:hypothetical protein